MGSGAPICRPMPKPSTCRCLFGRPSAEELAASMAEARRFNQLDVDEKSRKYDFDFKTETPNSNGKRWEWFRVVTAEGACKEEYKTPDVADRLQPPSLSESSQLSTVRCEDNLNVVVSVVDVADPSPAEPISTTTEAENVISSSRCRKRSGGKTMTGKFTIVHL